MGRMWQAMLPFGSKSPILALHIEAERAGGAFCCPFSSSDEFEAAVISARRRAGAYGLRRMRGLMVCMASVAGVVALALLAI